MTRCNAKTNTGRRCKNKGKLYGDMLLCTLHCKRYKAACCIQKVCTSWLYYYLDKSFPEILHISGEDTWKSVPRQYIIRLPDAEEWWDIRLLFRSIENHLNLTKYGLCANNIPESPWTRQKYTSQDATHILKRINDLKYSLFYKQLQTPNVVMLSLVAVRKGFNVRSTLNCHMRFQLLPETDSLNNYIGKWVDKKVPLSNFEKLIVVSHHVPGRWYNWFLQFINQLEMD
tara:strand:- start:5625 stop:6311 length:687 start_codon:yes stop_codon:yes gene_type:complete